jgi:polar amino acid transport system substrate-binding protein
LVDEQKGKYKLVSGIQDINAYFGVAFRKDDTDFLKFVNEQFAAMKASGELAALQTKWFGGTMDTPNEIPATLP